MAGRASARVPTRGLPTGAGPRALPPAREGEPPGTGICHTFLNDGDRDALLLAGGEADKPHDRIYYPLNPARRGDILDFKMFSNLSLNPIVELGGQGLLGLLDDVAALGWGTPRSSPAATPSSREPPSGSRETIQVTFPEGDGALVIPTPAVPG